MQDRYVNLRVPGPTPVPSEVAEAGARPMVNHRGPEFAAVMQEVVAGLKPFFGTKQDPLLLTGSGTGALEAAIVNVLSPGDEVLSFSCGVFGDRFADIAEAFGADVQRIGTDWGKAVQVEVVAEALRKHPEAKAVLLTHNETSTGVINNLEALAEVIRSESRETLLLVDGISSIGAVPFHMDAWAIDVAISCSQKAWMCPPGISMIAVSERGWEAHTQAGMPRFYWDFTQARKNGARGTTPFTPAVGVIRALQEALCLMAAEGLETIFGRHRHIGGRMRQGARDLGFELFAEPDQASDTVTAVRIPEDVEASSFMGDLRKQDVVVGAGQDWLKGSIFRIGHLGSIHDSDVDHLLEALRLARQHSRLPQTV